MKSPTLPSVCIEQEVCDANDQSLGLRETMASPQKIAVRNELAGHRQRSEFVRRGLASIARSEAAGDWILAKDVIAKLEAKVACARERRGKHAE
jgi:hypothetical protein